MFPLRLTLTATAAVVVALLLGPTVSPAGAVSPPGRAPVITTFEAGSFPESLAIDGSSLYVSLGFFGEIVRVTAAGAQTEIASLPIGHGLITGVVVAPDGSLYVADATFPETPTDPARGVFRVDPTTGATVRILTLPSSSFPNGLALHGGLLYVADSTGAIWRTDPAAPAVLTEPWLNDPLLAPTKTGLGANGIAFRGGVMYVAVSESGRIVRIPLGPNGNPLAVAVVTEQQDLRTADGIAFDVDGGLWITVNKTNRLYRLTLDGALVRIADRADGLSYPTMPAFGRAQSTRTTLYLADGAIANGTPQVQALDVGVAGLPLS